MIDELKKNVETEIEILGEISDYANKLERANEYERKLLEGAANALVKSLKIINNSIPEILKEMPSGKTLPSAAGRVKGGGKLEKVKFEREGSSVKVVLRGKDREQFFKELSISENLVRKIRRKKIIEPEKNVEFRGARGYLKLSNKFFRDTSINLVSKGYFKNLAFGIKKGNLDVLLETYVSMMIFSSFLAFFASAILVVFLLFVDVSFTLPFFGIYDGSYLLRFAKIFWLIFAVPAATFALLYVYPSVEKKSIEKKINQELPFAVIHMSAISGSGIEPSQIFKIISLGGEYPVLKKELRKIMNQINLYGYDLVTALNNVSKNVPSAKLAELFLGISNTLTSGASLPDFFEKRAESLMVDYRLEREKYTRTAETFMDIYISIVIAAPMVFLLLLIMLSITNVAVGFTSIQLSLIVVSAVALINILFLWFLQIKQPAY